MLLISLGQYPDTTMVLSGRRISRVIRFEGQQEYPAAVISL